MSNDSGPNPLRFRSAELVTAILDAIYEHPDPIPWPDLIHAFETEATPARTIEATIYDLIAYGAIHRIGKPPTRRQDDTRALRQTVLGRAWWQGEQPPERPTP